MAKVQIKGRVLPSAVDVWQNTGSKINFTDAGISTDFLIKVEHSVVTIDCECNNPITPDLIQEIYKRSFDLARASVDMISFANGYGLTVVLDTLTDDKGVVSQILIENPHLAPLCTVYGLEPARNAEYMEVYKIILAEPPVFMALNDLIVGVSYPHYAPVNCGRAIEGLRHLLAPGLEPKKQWPVMNNALRLDKSYTELIMSNSLKGRHGDRGTFIPGAVVKEISERAWTIMNRYLELRKRKVFELPQPEFPTLS